MMSYPEDCIQYIFGHDKWWQKDDVFPLRKGALVEAFINHTEYVPHTIEIKGRKEADSHGVAIATIGPMAVGSASPRANLPVAAMPLFDNEVYAVYKAKRRPCLVLSNKPVVVERKLTRGMSNSNTSATYLVAPFYGVEAGCKRGGFKSEFVKRIRHCVYPQFHWDHLPHTRGCESILRLDQLQPIGANYKSYKSLGYCLSDEALDLIDSQLHWVLSGNLPNDSSFGVCRDIIAETFG